MRKLDTRKSVIRIGIVFFCLIHCGVIISIINADSDTSTGSGDVQLFVNDPPTFDSVFDALLHAPYVNATFWAIIVDVDNTSTELNVTLWYSTGNWDAHNESILLTYNDTVSTDHYRFVYEFQGQARGTYYDYYFTGYDGEFNITDNNNGLYYSIQWGVAEGSVEGTWEPWGAINGFSIWLMQQGWIILIGFLIAIFGKKGLDEVKK